MPILNVQRRREWANGLRDYKIFIDGKLAGTVANGGQKSFELPAGPHMIVAKVDWAQSPEVDVVLEESQDRTLHVGMHRIASWAIPFFSVLVGLYFGLRISTNSPYTALILIPALAYIIYIITAGRKKYLRLEEETTGAVL